MPTAAPAAEPQLVLRFVIAAKQTFALLLLGALPLAILGLITVKLATGSHTFDFHTFWFSGRDVLHGRSPYPHSLPAIAHRTVFRPFVYPAPAAVAMVPFALIPYGVADLVWLAVGIGAVAGALRLLGVRDWRCYGAAFASVPVCSALGNGAISALLVLGLAALWRYRSRPWAAGALLAALVVFKLYLWPLGIWLLATRRVRATAYSVAIAAVATAAGWAAIGFAGLREYPHLLDRLTLLVGDQGYAPYALFRALGASPGAARLEMLGAGALLVAGMIACALRPGGERAAFALGVAASLSLTPIVWPHYLALVFVPLAVARPRFGLAWALPMTLWFFTGDWSRGVPSVIGGTLAVSAAVLCYAIAGPRARRSRRAPSPFGRRAARWATSAGLAGPATWP
ncbi:MAG: alpha,2-mannosyltransferase [Gaiellaceae bacterium]|nr:alpha,2-mannosyltransferase [Gaiellaceae bacterium]